MVKRSDTHVNNEAEETRMGPRAQLALDTVHHRATTGIPLHSRQAWLDWWDDSRDVHSERWLSVFVSRQVDQLQSPDYFLRSTAIGHLREIYGTTLDYDPKDTPAELQAGADRWRPRVSGEEPSDPGGRQSP